MRTYRADTAPIDNRHRRAKPSPTARAQCPEVSPMHAYNIMLVHAEARAPSTKNQNTTHHLPLSEMKKHTQLRLELQTLMPGLTRI